MKYLFLSLCFFCFALSFDKPPFTGLIAATYTAFTLDKEQKLNLTAIPLQADYLVKTGVTQIFVGGTTGESLILTMSERKELAEAWVKQGKISKIKVIVHVGCESLQEAYEFAKYCESIGVDGIGAMSSVFFRPASVGNLVDSMAFIAAGAPHTPFLYYHLPSMTGVTVGMPDFLPEAIKRIPNFSGIKFTDVLLNDVTDMQHTLKVMHLEKNVTLLYGRDEQFDVSVFMNMDGGVGSTYNYAGKIFNNIIAAYNKNDIESVRRFQNEIQKFVRIFVKYNTGNYNAHKLLCSWSMGVDLGDGRLPYYGLPENKRKEFRDELEKIGYFEWIKEDYGDDVNTNSWIIGGIITGVLVLVIAGIGLYYLIRLIKSKKPAAEGATTVINETLLPQ